MALGDTSSVAATPVAVRRGKTLSAVQRNFLAAYLRNPQSVALNMALLVHLDTQVDPGKFSAAFDRVVESSDVLRLRLVGNDSTDIEVAPGPTGRTEVVSVPRGKVAAWGASLAATPLDLRVTSYHSALAVHDDGTASWLLNIHHMATDAVTSRLVVDQTIEAYLDEQPSESKYFSWTKHLPVAQRAQVHWDTRSAAPRIGRLYASVDGSTEDATRYELKLSADTGELISTRLAAEYRMFSNDLSWTTLLVSATAVYLARVTGESKFAIGVPVHHRRGESARTVLGPVMNVYPLDIQLVDGATHREIFGAVSRSMVELLKHADPSVSPPTDYDAVVNVSMHGAATGRHEMPVTTEWISSDAIDPEHVLRVQANAYGQPANGDSASSIPRIELDVLDQAIATTQPHRVVHHFAEVLRAFVESPDGQARERAMCAPEELELIREAESRPALTPVAELLPDRLADRLADANQVVIEADGVKLTGVELWQWVLDVATEIDASIPVDERVGVELGPSVHAVVAIFAIMRSGRSFVPLDPILPAATREELRRTAGITHTFDDCRQLDELRSRNPKAIPEFRRVAPTDEAYVLFTSGSTGSRKGVPITHQGIADYIQFAEASYFANASAPLVAALFTSLSFDLTMTSLFAPLLSGGRLVAIDKEGAGSIASVAGRNDITWAKATPSHLEIFVALASAEHQLETLVVGGEAFGSELASRLLQLNPAMKIFNEYGPTEAWPKAVLEITHR